MFGTNVLSKGLTFGKVLNGISRGLTIANQAIPIYEQVKPMISNAKKLMSIVKEFKNTPSEKKDNKPLVKEESNKKTTISVVPTNNPVFFQ